MDIIITKGGKQDRIEARRSDGSVAARERFTGNLDTGRVKTSQGVVGSKPATLSGGVEG